MLQPAVSTVSILRVSQGNLEHTTDLLAVEEPMEIRVVSSKEVDRIERTLAITMRTPGNDFELALGFLFTEGIIKDCEQVLSVRYCFQVDHAEAEGNIVKVILRPDVEVDWKSLDRHFYTTSSCGICGKSSLEAVNVTACRTIRRDIPTLDPEFILALPQKLRQNQTIFTHTGGIHAAALFDFDGNLLLLREDIGRHNAVDKLIGAALNKHIPLDSSILFLSGRAGFELIQKARVAAIPIIIAVGAPSNLAASLARESGQTLIGFVRDGRYNVYAGVG